LLLLLSLLTACLPVPSPDLRRPATLVVIEGGDTTGVTVRACTWSTRHSPLDGCENFEDGMPAVDGIGVREWSTFPLILKGRSPAWADIFAACRGTTALGSVTRLPGFAPKWDDTVHVVIGSTTKMGVSSVADIDDATMKQLEAGICAGTIPLKAD
jgi:hypothetical protein